MDGTDPETAEKIQIENLSKPTHYNSMQHITC